MLIPGRWGDGFIEANLVGLGLAKSSVMLPPEEPENDAIESSVLRNELLSLHELCHTVGLCKKPNI